MITNTIRIATCKSVMLSSANDAAPDPLDPVNGSTISETVSGFET